jgi:hypothetical protein
MTTSAEPQPAGWASSPRVKSTAEKLCRTPHRVKMEQQTQWRRQGVKRERATVST